MTTLVLFAVLTPLVAWAVHCDIRRAVRRRRMRQLTAPMRAAFAGFQATIGAVLLPPMVRAAADLETSMRKVSEATAAYPDALERLKAMARDARP